MTDADTTSASSDEAGSYRVTLHENLQDPHLREVWLRFEDSSSLTAFQRFSFVENLFNHLAGDRNARPLIVAVRQKNLGIVMLMPFVRRQHLGLTWVEHVDFDLTDYAVPLTLPNHAFNSDDVTAISAEIIQSLKPADIVAIKKIRPTVQGRDNPLMMLPGLRAMNASCESIQLETRSDGIAMRDAAKKLRRLSKIGPVAFVQAMTASELSAALDFMIAQRTSRFSKMRRRDVLRDQRVTNFYRDLAYQGLNDGSVHLFSLKVGLQTIAVVYALEHHKTLTVLIPSMIDDENWQPYSPGLIALAQTAEWAQAHGMSQCDLGAGELRFKSRLGAKEQQLYEISWPLTLRGQLAAREAGLRRGYRALGRRFPAIDARIRRALGK